MPLLVFSGLIIAPCLLDQRGEQLGRVPLVTWLTCAYTVSVIIGPAWPKRSLMTSTRLTMHSWRAALGRPFPGAIH
jgi:hypothetical protein